MNKHLPGCPKGNNPQCLCVCGADNTGWRPSVDAVNHPQYDNYIDLMDRTGGSFAKAIAHAFRVADTGNRMRLLTAFDDLFARYKAQFQQWKESNHE